MRISETFRTSVLVVAAAALLGGSVTAHAFDQRDPVQKDSSPWALFKFGFSSYKKGRKKKAIEAYRYAAEKGHAGAQWKLGRMYAEGDGVRRDDYQAYKIFEKIVRDGADPGSRDETFVSDALVGLARYLKIGIPGSPVRRNVKASRDLYFQAASMYGNANAQFEVGRMMLTGEGGKSNVRQAVRWLGLSANKGHAGAQAELGRVLFESGQVVRGLAMMTAALERASPADRSWIRDMQEEAFALAGEADRRTAVALSQDILVKGTK